MPRSSIHFSIVVKSVLGLTALCAVHLPGFGWSQTTAVPQAPGAGEFRIEGTVVSKSDGHPLDRAAISVADVNNRKNSPVVITTEDGKFVFQGLAAGKYSLT